MVSEVLVVGESPSLAGSLVSLFEAERISVRSFPDLLSAEQYHARAGAPHPLLLVASNAYLSPSAEGWAGSVLRNAHLIVVGTRDPALRSEGRRHVVRLPIDPDGLLFLVRRCLASP